MRLTVMLLRRAVAKSTIRHSNLPASYIERAMEQVSCDIILILTCFSYYLMYTMFVNYIDIIYSLDY